MEQGSWESTLIHSVFVTTMETESNNNAAEAAQAAEMTAEEEAMITEKALQATQADDLYWEEVAREASVVEGAPVRDIATLEEALEEIGTLRRSLIRRNRALDGVRRIYHQDVYIVRQQLYKSKSKT